MCYITTLSLNGWHTLLLLCPQPWRCELHKQLLPLIEYFVCGTSKQAPIGRNVNETPRASAAYSSPSCNYRPRHMRATLTELQTCANIPERSGMLDPEDPGSWILEDLGCYIFIFHGILEILDPVTATFFSWDLADLGSCKTIMSPHF